MPRKLRMKVSRTGPKKLTIKNENLGDEEIRQRLADQPAVHLKVTAAEIIRKGREVRTRHLMRVFSGNAKNKRK